MLGAVYCVKCKRKRRGNVLVCVWLQASCVRELLEAKSSEGVGEVVGAEAGTVGRGLFVRRGDVVRHRTGEEERRRGGEDGGGEESGGEEGLADEGEEEDEKVTSSHTLPRSHKVSVCGAQNNDSYVLCCGILK